MNCLLPVRGEKVPKADEGRSMTNPTDLYWQAKKDAILEQEYREFLRQRGLEHNPDSAQLFAMNKRDSGFTEKSERELILQLAGELPFMY